MNHPLESESGTISDHKIVFLEAKLPRQKKFAWETHYYMRTTDEGNSKFKELLKAETWDRVQKESPNNHKMASAFHSILREALDKCFQWKKVRRKSNDKAVDF